MRFNVHLIAMIKNQYRQPMSTSTNIRGWKERESLDGAKCANTVNAMGCVRSSEATACSRKMLAVYIPFSAAALKPHPSLFPLPHIWTSGWEGLGAPSNSLPGLPSNHHQTPIQSSLPAFSSHFQQAALLPPEKPPHVSSKRFATFLVCVWHHKSTSQSNLGWGLSRPAAWLP